MIPGELFTSISPYQINEIWNWDRHSVEPVTAIKCVAESEQMWKLMVEFLSKFEGRGIKIDKVYSTRVAESMIFLNIFVPLHREWSSWAIQ